MRPGEQTRLERLFPAPQRAFEIERTDHPVLGRPERQVDEGHGAFADPARLAGIGARPAIFRSAAESTILDRADRR